MERDLTKYTQIKAKVGSRYGICGQPASAIAQFCLEYERKYQRKAYLQLVKCGDRKIEHPPEEVDASSVISILAQSLRPMETVKIFIEGKDKKAKDLASKLKGVITRKEED